jgi:hypothetical protein
MGYFFTSRERLIVFILWTQIYIYGVLCILHVHSFVFRVLSLMSLSHHQPYPSLIRRSTRQHHRRRPVEVDNIPERRSDFIILNST